MPCYVTGSAEGDASLKANKVRDELTRVTRLLCAVCELADKNYTLLPAQVSYWWNEHKKIDEKRKADYKEYATEQKRINTAKAKLTMEERKLLGI